MAWWPDAIRQQLPRNYGPAISGPIGVTLHHQAGSGNPYSVYLSRGVSAHFWIPYVGKPVQHVDTAQQSWHGMSLNRQWIGVETEGCGAPPHAQPLNENQLVWFGRLMAWANKVHGIPLQLSNNATTRGLNYHRVAVATGCPCDVRVNARPEILRRARTGGAAAPAPKPPPPKPKIVPDAGEPVMLLVFNSAKTALIGLPGPARALRLASTNARVRCSFPRKPGGAGAPRTEHTLADSRQDFNFPADQFGLFRVERLDAGTDPIYLSWIA